MNRLLILFVLFVTIIVNGVVFDVLQPGAHGHDNQNSGSNNGLEHGH